MKLNLFILCLLVFGCYDADLCQLFKQKNIKYGKNNDNSKNNAYLCTR